MKKILFILLFVSCVYGMSDWHTAHGSAWEQAQMDNNTRMQQQSQIRKMVKDKEDLYAIIGVPRTATIDEIKKQYKTEALKAAKAKNHDRRAELNNAKDILTNDDLKRYYDQEWNYAPKSTGAGAGSWGGFGGWSAPSPNRKSPTEQQFQKDLDAINKKYSDYVAQDPAGMEEDVFKAQWADLYKQAENVKNRWPVTRTTGKSDWKNLEAIIKIARLFSGNTTRIDVKKVMRTSLTAFAYYKKVLKNVLGEVADLIAQKEYNEAIIAMQPFTPDTSAKIINTYITWINEIKNSDRTRAKTIMTDALTEYATLQTEANSFGGLLKLQQAYTRLEQLNQELQKDSAAEQRRRQEAQVRAQREQAERRKPGAQQPAQSPASDQRKHAAIKELDDFFDNL